MPACRFFHGMRYLVESITVDAPVRRAFAAWDDPEEYPRFLPWVLAVDRLGEGRYRFQTATPGGPVDQEMVTTQRIVDETLGLRAVTGPPHALLVTARELSPRRTLVKLAHIDGPDEERSRLEGAAAVVERMATGLHRFKHLVEDASSGPGDNARVPLPKNA